MVYVSFLVSMKNILIYIDWFTPAYKAGGPIQSLQNLIDKMGDHFNFDIITSDKDIDGIPLKIDCRNKWFISENARIIYISKKIGLLKEIKECHSSRKYSYIYINSMYSFWYSILPILYYAISGSRSKIVLAPRGMLQNGALKTKYIKKRIFLSLFRLSGLHKRLIFHATDPQEQNDIKKIFGNNVKVFNAANFINIPTLSYKRQIKEKHKANFIFISVFSRKKNLGFFLELLSSIKGSVKLDIFGYVKDTGYFEECISIINKLPANIIVSVKNVVKHYQVFEEISNHDFFVLPTLGENYGHAIFESLVVKRPVLISDQTPWNNIESQRAGWSISLSDRVKWIDTIQKCVDIDNQEYQNLCEGAGCLAKDYIEKNNPVNDYKKLFTDAGS